MPKDQSEKQRMFGFRRRRLRHREEDMGGRWCGDVSETYSLAGEV